LNKHYTAHGVDIDQRRTKHEIFSMTAMTAGTFCCLNISGRLSRLSFKDVFKVFISS
jgi:hypothetical protein